MNITEANASQTLLRWVSELVMVEHRTGDTQGRSTVTDPRLLEAVGILAARSSATLGAGLSAEQATARMRVLLGLALDDTDPAADPDGDRDALDSDDALDAPERGAA